MATEHSRCFTRTHMFSTYQFIVMTTATSFLAPVPPRNVVRIQVRVSTSTLLLAAVLTHPWVTQNILLLSGKLLLLYLTIMKCYPLQKSYILKGYLKWRCKFARKHRKYANISTCLVWWFYAYLYKRCVFLCVLFLLLLFGGRGSNLTSSGCSQCWFPLHQWRARKGWLVMFSFTLSPHMPVLLRMSQTQAAGKKCQLS